MPFPGKIAVVPKSVPIFGPGSWPTMRAANIARVFFRDRARFTPPLEDPGFRETFSRRTEEMKKTSS